MTSAPKVRAARTAAERVRRRIDRFVDPDTIREHEHAARDGNGTFDEICQHARRRRQADLRTALELYRGEIPAAALGLATNYAGWAYRNGWSDDEHELISAAIAGVWRAAEKAVELDAPPRDWRSWVAGFVRPRLRNVRRNRFVRFRGTGERGPKGEAGTVRRHGVVGREDDVGRGLADPKATDPAEDLHRRTLWGQALTGLSPKQAEAVRYVFRDGLTQAEADELFGIKGGSTAKRIDAAAPVLARNLKSYARVLHPPGSRGRRTGARSVTLNREHYLDDETYAAALAVLPPGTGGSADLRGVLSALSYRWRTGCPWRRLPASLPGFGMVRAWLMRAQAAGLEEELRAVLAPEPAEAVA